MFWILVYVLAFLLFWGMSKIFDILYNRVEAARAEKRATNHFEATERFRRSIG